MISLIENADPIDPAANPLDDVTDHVLAARKITTQLGDVFLTYLLDMALIEIAQHGATRSN